MSSGRRLARNIQISGAILLVWAYLQDVLLTLQAMSFQQDEHGTWQVVVDGGSISPSWSIIALMIVLGGLFAFLIGYLIKQGATRHNKGERSRLSFRDMVNAFGWVGLLFFGGLLLFYLVLHNFIPDWFRHSAGASAIGGVSMQIAAILVIPLYFRKSSHEIGLTRPLITTKMVLYVLMFFVMTYAMSLSTNMLGGWLGINTDSYREQHISQELHQAMVGGWLLSLLPLLATSLIAPIGEELLFRGVLQSTLTAKFGNLIGVLGSAFCFSLIHADLVLFIPIFLMGVLFAVLYRITGSLWAPIWLHMLNNLFASLADLWQ